MFQFRLSGSQGHNLLQGTESPSVPAIGDVEVSANLVALQVIKIPGVLIYHEKEKILLFRPSPPPGGQTGNPFFSPRYPKSHSSRITNISF